MMTVIRALSALLLVISLTPSLMAEPIRISGRILGSDSSGLAGAQVELFPAAGMETEEASALASTRTGQDGAFEIAAPESGLYTLRVRAKGHVSKEIPLKPLVEDRDLPRTWLLPELPLSVRAVGPDGRPLAGVEIRLGDFRFGGQDWKSVDRSGTTGADGRVSLPRAEHDSAALAVTSPLYLGEIPQSLLERRTLPETVRLSPRRAVPIEVRGADGKPVPGARVRWKTWAVGVTGPDGRLTVTLPEGNDPLVVDGPDGWQGRIAAPGGPREDGAAVVRLEPPRTITGKVVSSASRLPVAGALVWSESSPARTGADGSFRLVVPGSARGVWIETAAAGHLAAQRSFVPKGAGPVTLTLDPASALSGIVVDSAGRPVAGALVQPLPAPRRSPSGQIYVSTRPDGRFRLTGLIPQGTYRLEVTGPGIVRASVTARTVAPGKPSPEIRIVLPEGRTVFGRIEDETGHPVAEAPVLMSLQVATWPDGILEPAKAVSDAAGRFEIRSLSPGSYSLHAVRDGFSSANQTIEVPVGPGETDLGTVKLPAGAVIEGRVTDTRGAPIDKAEVRIATRQTSFGSFDTVFSLPEKSELEAVHTGPDGTFRIPDLRRGKTYKLMARHSGHVEASAPSVQAPTPEPVRIELRPARTLSGRVVDPEGEPVRGADVFWVEDLRLSVAGGMPDVAGGLRSQSVTDAEGFFEISGLEPGLIHLEVSAPGYKPKRLSAVQIPEDRDAERLTIPLDRGSFVDVRVLDSAGEPVVGAWVMAFPESPADSSPFLFSSGLRSLEPATDGEGLVRIEIQGPGRYRISARGWDQEASTTVEVEQGTTPQVELRLKEGAQLSGRITGEDGWGIAGAQVVFGTDEPDQGYETSVESDADGSFLSPSLKDGAYRLRAEKTGFAQPGGPLEVEVAGRPVAGIEIRLAEDGTSGGALSGRLLGLTLDEAAQAQIEATRTGLLLPIFGRATAEGTYRLTELSPGFWTVRASTPAGRRAAGTVQLDPGVPEAVLDLDFSGFTLEGQALADGSPLAGAAVWLARQDRELQAVDATATAVDGSFTLRNLSPGAYALILELDGAPGDMQSLEITEDREVRIEIRTGTLTGRIVSAATGEPVPGALVEIRGKDHLPETDSPLRNAWSGPDGAFAPVRLVAGTYRLTVRNEGFAPAETVVTVQPGGTAVIEVPLAPLP
jgi:hypothetical protein